MTKILLIQMTLANPNSINKRRKAVLRAEDALLVALNYFWVYDGYEEEYCVE